MKLTQDQILDIFEKAYAISDDNGTLYPEFYNLNTFEGTIPLVDGPEADHFETVRLDCWSINSNDDLVYSPEGDEGPVRVFEILSRVGAKTLLK